MTLNFSRGALIVYGCLIEAGEFIQLLKFSPDAYGMWALKRYWVLVRIFKVFF